MAGNRTTNEPRLHNAGQEALPPRHLLLEAMWTADSRVCCRWKLFRIPAKFAVVIVASLPKTGTWLMVRKSVVVPRKYRGDSVWIEVYSTTPNFAQLACVNGVVRCLPNMFKMFGFRYAPNPLLVNITPDIHFGQANDIIIGGGNWWNHHPGTGNLQSARLIFVPPQR